MHIPPQAKLVFKGIIYDVYQWEQAQYDGSTATYEMLKRPNTLQIIAIKNNKILLIDEQQAGCPAATSFIGGRQEPDENPEQGAKRELLEEAGMVSNDWELFQTYNPIDKIEWCVHVFIAKNAEIVSEPNLDPGEKISVKELSFEEFSDFVLNGGLHSQEFVSEFRRWKIQEPKKIEELKKKLGLV